MVSIMESAEIYIDVGYGKGLAWTVPVVKCTKAYKILKKKEFLWSGFHQRKGGEGSYNGSIVVQPEDHPW